MAIIDESRGVLVVRIVYDGPALSGKTTSLRALASGFSSTIACPEEVSGRTLFFDWVDYVGGLFEGRQIRCQIVSVPGQRELDQRRRLLLETADSVVLVLDTRRREWDFALEWVTETVPYCRSKEPPIGLVLQANKRDDADAVPLPEMRERVNRIAPLALVNSTATTGDGIREAFVLAVRLALDRVRALAASGRLLTGKPIDDEPSDLLERLRGADRELASAIDPEFAKAATSAFVAEYESPSGGHASASAEAVDATGAPADEALFVPDPLMPGGMIWPPVDGRALLHEVASLGIRPSRTGRADWGGSGSGFRFHSLSTAIFSDPSRARHELIEWARQHAASASSLSAGRAVILADAGAGRLRLWQIVRAEATLRERLAQAMPLADPREVASELLAVATQLIAARESFASSSVALPCTLWSVSANSSNRPTFVGLMPARDDEPSPEPGNRALIERELLLHLRQLPRARVDYATIIAHLVSLAERAHLDSPARWLAELALAS